MPAAFPIQFKTPVKKLEHLAGHYIVIPAKIVNQIGTLKIRLICTINDTVRFQCGLVAHGEGAAYITVNAKRLKELKIKAEEMVRVTLEEDTSKYGMDVPKELAEVLKQDPEGMKRFKGLPPGKQRYIIYYVSGVKSTQLRVDRALLLIENLKLLPIGKESFREMLGKGKRL